jgi:hypothetical protein
VKDTSPRIKKEYFLNADFDISLNSERPRSHDLRSFVEELSVHYIFAASPGDSVIVYPQIPDEYFGYIENTGLQLPKIIYFPEVTPDSIYVPFGWNGMAMKMSEAYHESIKNRMPLPEVVKKVNSRLYSSELEMKIDPGSYESHVCHTLSEIEKLVGRPSDREWLLKTNHGNSGIGHRRIGPKQEFPSAWIERELALEEPLILEPWYNRIMDIGSNFELTPEGEVKGLVFHETLNTDTGAFAGVRLYPNEAWLESWRGKIEDTVRRVAEGLFHEGYMGPVSLDSFVWKDENGDRRLRSLVEINARHSMALPAHGLWEQLEKGGVLVWRLYASDNLILPDSYKELKRVLSKEEMGFGHQAKLVFTSPLTIIYKDKTIQPRRTGVLFFGEHELALEQIQEKFDSCFLKK